MFILCTKSASMEGAFVNRLRNFVFRKSKILNKPDLRASIGNTKIGVPCNYLTWEPFVHTDGRGHIESASDTDQEYIFFTGSATPPSICYICTSTLWTNSIYPSGYKNAVRWSKLDNRTLLILINYYYINCNKCFCLKSLITKKI